MLNVRLSAEQIAVLDRLAKADGVVRSEVVRRLLTEALDGRVAR